MKKILPFISLPILAMPVMTVISCSSSDGPGDAIMCWSLDNNKLNQICNNEAELVAFNELPNSLDKLIQIIKIKGDGNILDRYTKGAFYRGDFDEITINKDNKTVIIKLKQNSPFFLPNDSKEWNYKFE